MRKAATGAGTSNDGKDKYDSANVAQKGTKINDGN